MGVRAASSLGVEDAAAAAAAGVNGLGVVGCLGGGVLVISPKGFRIPVAIMMIISIHLAFPDVLAVHATSQRLLSRKCISLLSDL